MIYLTLSDLLHVAERTLGPEVPVRDHGPRGSALALAATLAFLGLNGYRLTLSNDQAYALVIDVATGLLDDVSDIAERIGAGIAARVK